MHVSSSITRPHGSYNSKASCQLVSFLAVFQTQTGLRWAMWQFIGYLVAFRTLLLKHAATLL